MITESMIAEQFNHYRRLIERTTESENIPAPSGVTYAHFKAGFLLASSIDLARNGFGPHKWQGDEIKAVAGEDLLG